jgi:hypothetical protein
MAQQAAPGKKLTLAVMALESNSLNEDELTVLSSRIESTLLSSRLYTIVERSRMEQILAEQGFQTSGACEEQSCKIEMGRLLSVDQLVIGNVGMIGSNYVLNLKLVDVESGSIVRSAYSELASSPGQLYLTECDRTVARLSLQEETYIPNTAASDEKATQLFGNLVNEIKPQAQSLQEELKPKPEAPAIKEPVKRQEVSVNIRSIPAQDDSDDFRQNTSYEKTKSSAIFWNIISLGSGIGNFYLDDNMRGLIHSSALSLSFLMMLGDSDLASTVFLINWISSAYTPTYSYRLYRQKMHVSLSPAPIYGYPGLMAQLYF